MFDHKSDNVPCEPCWAGVEIALEEIKSREETQQSGIQEDDRDASHLQHLSLLFGKAVIIW